MSVCCGSPGYRLSLFLGKESTLPPPLLQEGLPFSLAPLLLGEARNLLGCGHLSWLWSWRQGPWRDPALWEQLCKDTAQAPSELAQALTHSHTSITGSNLSSAIPCFAALGLGWPQWHKVTVVAPAWS